MPELILLPEPGRSNVSEDTIARSEGNRQIPARNLSTYIGADPVGAVRALAIAATADK